MEVQTRNHSGELKFFQTPKEAFDYAEENSSVWKVSFEGTRFVRVETVDGKWAWFYQPMDKIVENEIKKLTEKHYWSSENKATLKECVEINSGD